MRKVCYSLYLSHGELNGRAALGAKVIATASSTAKLDVCKKHGGADFAVDYTKPNWHKEVLDLTGGKGVGDYVPPLVA